MIDPRAYLAQVEVALMTSPVIAEYTFLTRWANTDDGYIRFRAILVNNDFLEAAAYFTVQGDKVQIEDYRYQWMDHARTTLRRRWDNTPHHPGVAGFPHHCHIGSETNVVPGKSLSVLEVLAWFEIELS
ncbi:MAG: hypothetical protein JXA33_26985 [Anaerolineae bacterium]|nr:hypothetical protein [Anaerolineae bacterium]